MEYHKLTRETARLKTLLLDIETPNKLSEKEFELKEKAFFDNIEKLKEIELNKLLDEDDKEEYLKKHEKIIREYERILLTPKGDLKKTD